MTDEDIDATKAPLLDHLIELRARLIRALIAFLAAFLVCFYFSRTIYNVLTEPYVRVVGAENATLIATHFLEQFYTNIQLSMFGAGVIAFPIMPPSYTSSSRRASTGTSSRRSFPTSSRRRSFSCSARCSSISSSCRC